MITTESKAVEEKKEVQQPKVEANQENGANSLLPDVTTYPALELLQRLSPKLASRTGIALIFSYLWEFNQACANIMRINKAGR